MTPSDLLAWYTAAAPVILGTAAFLVLALPIVGRLIATWKPRAGEALIRAGADIGGALGVRKLEPGTPSVSAQPLQESAAAVAASQPSVAPPSGPKPPMPPTLLGCFLLALLVTQSGCTAAQGQALLAQVPKIGGAVCDALDDDGVSPFVRFACKVVSGSDGALSNMGTGPQSFERTRVRDEIWVVPREQAARFAAENGGPQ